MKRVLMAFLILVLALSVLSANTLTVRLINGTAEVRHGVSEEWKSVAVGDVLRPEDTIRTGERSSLVLMVGTSRVTISEMTMVDMVDFRQMSREDFMLRLAMEDILAVPGRSDDKITLPSATVLHGSQNRNSNSIQTKFSPASTMLLRGAKLLFDYGYVATSVLRLKSSMALYPEMKSSIDALTTLAIGYEKMNLENEAKGVYLSMLSNDLTDSVRKKVESSIERLKSKK